MISAGRVLPFLAGFQHRKNRRYFSGGIMPDMT
jgi:hypothetical protein